jgi:hypothetical protein
MSSTLAESSSTAKSTIDKKSGRPFSRIWEDITRGEAKGNGHYSGTCKYCLTHWKRAKPYFLKNHLIQCGSTPVEVKEYWKQDLYGTEEENSSTDSEYNDTSSKRKKNFNTKNNKKSHINDSHQSDIRNHFSNTQSGLEAGVVGIIDKVLLNAFVSCGIPFAVIENPFFLELLKVLQPLYKPPTRQRMAGSLLKYESGQIDKRIEQKLEKGENYTLGKFFNLLFNIN